MAAVLAFFSGRLAAWAALLLAAGLAWQTARIDGLPLIGGGLKAEVAQFQARIAADALTRAQSETAALAAQVRLAANAEEEARAHALASRANDDRIRTIIERVPANVSTKSNSACVVPLGAVRLLDAAASGADPDSVAAAIAPGQPDDAAAGIALSDAIALLAADLAIARDNADQLTHLERAVGGQSADPK
jgi:hypothetical protein